MSREVIMVEDEFLTAEEAVELVNCSLMSLWRWVRQGHLNEYRAPGGAKRYKLSELMRMLERGAAGGWPGRATSRW